VRIQWPALLQGTLIRRYQRFKADVKLRNGRLVTAHCPNSGSMAQCSEPGRPAYLSREDTPHRRLRYTWWLIHMPTSLVGVHTSMPNWLTREAIMAGAVPSLSGYHQIRTEVKYGENSRVDLLLEKEAERCYVEVKNCTLVENGIAYFPDAVTERGRKHLVELKKQVHMGNRAAMFFLIQRMDAVAFRPADHIDPVYGRELRKAFQNGVEIFVYDVRIDLEGIELHRTIPFQL
jgi:sugar fermentation stimulation protein A